MDKFIYAVGNSHKKTNVVKVICARHFKDAQDKIIQEYWDKFLVELCNKHGVLISKELIEINELNG